MRFKCTDRDRLNDATKMIDEHKTICNIEIIDHFEVIISSEAMTFYGNKSPPEEKNI